MADIDTKEKEPPLLAPKKSSLPIRGLRVVRKSLEDDGIIGRLVDSPIYNTLCNLRSLLIPLDALLEGIEYYLGYYLMDGMTKIQYSMQQYINKSRYDGGRHLEQYYSPLGHALQSETARTFTSVILLWCAFDFGMATLYHCLEWVTREEWEVVKRQYEEAQRKLGVEVESEEEKKENQRRKGWLWLDRLVNHKIYKVLWSGIMLWTIFSIAGDFADDVLDEVQSHAGDMKFDAMDLASVNPYRNPLPADQDGVLREILYIAEVLSDISPTTIPEQDDYEFISALIKNLETRTDLSWRIYEESDLRWPVMRAAGRRGYNNQTLIANEPFSIHERVVALHNYWDALSLEPGRPERWDDESDTTFIRPILHGRSLEGNDHQSILKDKGYKLVLTEEQSSQADKIYRKWRKNYDREASYLKDHPPKPIGWVPIPKSTTGTRNAWDSLFDDGVVKAGRSVSNQKIASSKAFKPIYGTFHDVPYDWKNPAETVEGEAQVDEDEIIPDEDWKAMLAKMDAERKVKDERRERQEAVMKTLRKKRKEEEERLKEEEKEKEGEEAEKRKEL